MTVKADIICIGSVLWDIIGRSGLQMHEGNDKPGRITRIPGGVALNIAMTLKGLGLQPTLLSVVGADSAGLELIRACDRLEMLTEHLLIDPDLPTDQYMAIESQGRLIAAIADAHSLETAGARILAPLKDGTLASPDAPWTGPIVLDGNLTGDLLAEIASDPQFAQADLRLAPASPGKAERLLPFLEHPNATLYVNCEEAGLLTATTPNSAEAGAAALLAKGARRVLVTDGAKAAVDASPQGMFCLHPPPITPRRITGAGDTFMAAHIAAELRGEAPETALATALNAAAHYVAG